MSQLAYGIASNFGWEQTAVEPATRLNGLGTCFVARLDSTRLAFGFVLDTSTPAAGGAS